MHIENKNKILLYHYGELNKKDLMKVEKQIALCDECKSYSKNLKMTENYLNKIDIEIPNEAVLDNIMYEANKTKKESVVNDKSDLIAFILKTFLGILFLLVITYFMQISLQELKIWESLKDNWFIETIGSFGLSAIILFFTGTFVTLSLAPIIIMNSKQNNNMC